MTVFRREDVRSCRASWDTWSVSHHEVAGPRIPCASCQSRNAPDNSSVRTARKWILLRITRNAGQTAPPQSLHATTPLIDAKVELPPATPAAATVFRGRPLTCPDDRETRAVEHEMDALAGRDRSLG